MAIFTPQGLKIRLSVKEAFTYLARLYPKVSAYSVLKAVEGIELLPNHLAIFVGIYCFLNDSLLFEIALFSFVAIVVGRIFVALKLFMIPMVVKINVLLTYFTFFSIPFLTITYITIGLITVGWLGVVMYFVGRCAASLIFLCIVEPIFMLIEKKNGGMPLTSSERNFFNALMFYAVYNRINFDFYLSDSELASNKWEKPFLELQQKYPQVVARFTL